jgi:virginiamycin B lyase
VGRVTPAGSFTIRSFPMNNHMSTDITAGPDGAVWFAFPNSVPPYDTGKIGRIAPTGEVTFFTIPWVSDAESITTGPDGNLWFADHVAAALGRLTPTGRSRSSPYRARRAPTRGSSRRARTARCGSPTSTATGSGG